jgi:hypothetical protein
MSFAENNALLVAVQGTASSTPLVSSYVNAKNCGEVSAVVHFGDMASETLDVALYQAVDSSGTSAKALMAITQIAAHASNNDSKQVVISARADEFDVDGGFEHVAVRIVTGGATGGTVNGQVWGSDLRYGPASLVDNASVVQIVP